MLAKTKHAAGAFALGTALLLVGCTNPATPTGGDAPPGVALYQPPSPLRGSRPGDVQWYRTSTSATFANAKIYTMLYRSIDALDAPMAVSGSVLVPNAPYAGGGPRPILAFAPQTTGITDDCAASKGIVGAGGGGWSENANVQAALQRGWAVAVTDYQGLGTPGRHTYMVRKAQGNAVLDSVRAATRLEGSGLSTTAPVVIWGYSQGGGAAAAAAELAAAYAPELQVKGTAAGGVPADLIAVEKSLNGTFYGFALAAAQGFDAAYPELRLAQYTKPAGAQLMQRWGAENATGGCLWTLVLNFAGQRQTTYTTQDITAVPAWAARLNESKLGTVKPSAPVFQYHASLDEVIPATIGGQLKARWCGLGATVLMQAVTGEHLTGNAAGINPAMTYLANRIAGQPAQSNCGAA
jgi:pimeloyl-ACP methyl ester carboxylesterase